MDVSTKKRSKSKTYKKAKKYRTTYRVPVKRFTPDLGRIGPGGNQMLCRLKYVDEGTLNPGVAGLPVFKVYCNSLYDPDNSGIGYQPASFDQLMALYEGFVVYGMSYRIEIINPDSGTTVVGVSISDTSYSGEADFRVCISQGQTDWKLTRAGGTGERAVFTGYVNCAAVHGVTKSQMLGDAQYEGTAAANPPDMAFLNLWAAGLNTTDTGAVGYLTEITYYAQFKGSKKIALS